MHSFEFPVAWVATSRLDHCLLARGGYGPVSAKERRYS